MGIEDKLTRESQERPKIPEYNFENGTNEVVARIVSILEGGRENAVVAFSAPSSDAGKTKLATTVMGKLKAFGYFARALHGCNEDDMGQLQEDLKRSAKFEIDFNRKKIVFIFEQLWWDSVANEDQKGFRETWDTIIHGALQSINQNVSGIDLWVGIYRSDEPFCTTVSSNPELPASPVADILIRNEHARRKS